MFVNPLWSAAIIAGLVLMYLVIRLKHGGPLLLNNEHVHDWKTRWWKRIVAFRSWVAIAVWGVLTAVPDLAVALLPIDLSWLVGAQYAKITTGVLTAFLAVNTAFRTKPDGKKA